MRIRSEDTFLVGYVLFDRRPDVDERSAVEAARARIERGLAEGELRLPSAGAYDFAGSYENEVRGRETLALLVPVVLAIVFVLLHLQFRSVPTTALVFSSIVVAWAGGFVLLWLYGRPWFLDFTVFDVPMRQLFQVGTVNLSVATWVGFLALFGIATDDGVVMATYLDGSFRKRAPRSIDEVREATVRGAVRRLRPCLMTSATTILALLPVLTSTGRGSDVMAPMALPAVGGMMVVLLTLFIVPTGYAAVAERRVRRLAAQGGATAQVDDPEVS
jgi:Cu(I)/Ag(I) efflux system membrane protein CusA/SilA